MGNCLSQEQTEETQELSAEIVPTNTSVQIIDSDNTNPIDQPTTTSHHGLDIDAMHAKKASKMKKSNNDHDHDNDNEQPEFCETPKLFANATANKSSSVVARLLVSNDTDCQEIHYNEFDETNVDPITYFHDDFYGQNEYILSPFLVKKHKITKQLSHIYLESKAQLQGQSQMPVASRLGTIKSQTSTDYTTMMHSGGQMEMEMEMDELNYKIPIVYCDWTASGKNLKCIENYIDTVVRPLYANTHTQTSVTGKQTTLFRNEARSMILNSDSINGDEQNDVLIFCGNGVTGAIFKLANILMKGKQYTPEKTIVFAGMYEHNSNLFIWKELGIKVIIIPEYQTYNNDNCKTTTSRSAQTTLVSNQKKGNFESNLDSDHEPQEYGINTDVLEAYLKKYSNNTDYNLIIGSFSAASNVSGIIEKSDEITDLLHKYNALSFWDYATGGPYLNMNMEKKDAIFLSPHKFLGGPGCPGILICKKRLCTNSVPVVAGGGTVFAAYGIDPKQNKNTNTKRKRTINSREPSSDDHDHEQQTLLNTEESQSSNDHDNHDNRGDDEGLLFDKANNADTSKYSQYEYFDVSTPQHIAEREEGGTPNIIGSIRSALVFLVKDIIGVERMEKIEHEYCDLFFKLMKPEIDNGILQIVGNTKCPRLPIISFNVKYKNKLLHHNFIAALLNDLFGIQGRGGCSCAGMYGLNELSKQMKIDVNHMMDQLKLNNNELARYGYYRINFHYTLKKQEFDYIINCLKYVCNHAWKFLALYDIDKQSGLYIHRSQMISIRKKNKDLQSNHDNYKNPNRLIYASLKDIKFQQHSTHDELHGGLSLEMLKMESKTRSIIYDKVSSYDQCMQFANNVIANMKDYLPSRQDILNEEKVNDDEQFYWLPSQLYDRINDACQNDGGLLCI